MTPVIDSRASAGASDPDPVPVPVNDSRASSGVIVDPERLDAGWTNSLLGFGGERDRMEATTYRGAVCRLADPVLVAMYATEDLSAKVVDVYPREAMRESFEIGGFDNEQKKGAASGKDGTDPETVARKYICDQWGVPEMVLEWAIWSRLFGGGAIWFGTSDTGESLKKPLQDGEKITFLRGVDRRYLTALSDTSTYDAQGRPVFYNLTKPEGGTTIATLHRSRLVFFPGAFTEPQTRLTLGHWDYSVLQRVYNALRSGGSMWKSAELLMSEASIGVLQIQDLWATVAGKQKEVLATRLAQFNLNRAISKAMVLDKEREDFKRVTATFAGLADLTDRAMKRIACAAEIPVTVLMGEAPAGLNATGDSDLRWFLMRVNAYRMQVLAPRILRIVRVLLAAADSPVKPPKDLTIRWPALWTPSAKEQSEIYLSTSTADGNYIDRGVATPEEIGLSRFGDDGYSQETEIRRELREQVMQAEVSPTETTETNTDPAAPSAKPGATGENVQTTVLNGAQITSMIEVVRAVTKKEIARESGKEILVQALGLDPAEAEKMLGPIGFKAPEEPKPAPVGGGGKPPGAPPAPPKDAPPAKE
jgi:uncharacterized protein